LGVQQQKNKKTKKKKKKKKKNIENIDDIEQSKKEGPQKRKKRLASVHSTTRKNNVSRWSVHPISHHCYLLHYMNHCHNLFFVLIRPHSASKAKHATVVHIIMEKKAMK